MGRQTRGAAAGISAGSLEVLEWLALIWAERFAFGVLLGAVRGATAGSRREVVPHPHPLPGKGEGPESTRAVAWTLGHGWMRPVVSEVGCSL